VPGFTASGVLHATSTNAAIAKDIVKTDLLIFFFLYWDDRIAVLSSRTAAWDPAPQIQANTAGNSHRDLGLMPRTTP
jgi:hypothetical protein